MNETVHQEPVTTAAGVQQEPRTFTQDEVNSIIADRRHRGSLHRAGAGYCSLCEAGKPLPRHS